MARKQTDKHATKEAPQPRRYKKDYLHQVIARIDFASPITLPPGGPPQQLIEAARRQFPVAEHKKLLVKHIHVTTQETQDRREEKHEWSYCSTDRLKLLKFTEDLLVLEYRQGKYKSFDQMRAEFMSATNALYDSCESLQVKRLGLRYINKITLNEKNPMEWSRYLDAKLLTMFDLADDRSTISRAFHWLEFNYGDTNLRFQYGMANPDYPAQIRQKLFVLDYDAYCTLLITREDMCAYLDRFHEKIKASFEEVITDSLRKKMGVINA